MKDDEAVLLEAARAAERSGDYASAFNTWQRLAFGASRPDYLCKLGRMAERLGRWTNAEEALLEALKLDPTFMLAKMLLGSLFLARTDGDLSINALKAKAWLEQVRAESPNPMSLSLLGAAHNRLEEKEAAIEAFRKAIELDASYAEAYFNLGVLLADRGQNEEAEKLLRTATQLDPKSHRAHGRLGILLQQQGRFLEAESELKRSLELDPTDNVARSYLDRAVGSQRANN